jgi:prepilin-type N-terminal cleavage/methylation domain-containing protein
MMKNPLTRPMRSGFTIIELMIVLVMASVLMLGGVWMAGQLFSAGLSEDEGKLATMVRYLRTQAALNGQTYRLVIDLDEHTYWGEVLPVAQNECDTFFLEPESDEEGAKGSNSQFDALEGIAGKETSNVDGGKPQKRSTHLPHVRFRGGITTSTGKQIEEGKLYVHFFPSGYVEHAFIYIGDEEEIHTIETLPLAGAVRVYDEKLDERTFERLEKEGNF